MKNLLVLIPFLIGCASQEEKSHYEKLLDYEGNYQYINQSSLDILASELDTTLYAVIDNAKYPLKHIGIDSFVDNQNSPVVFQRGKNNAVVSYTTEGQLFKLINKEASELKMIPRKDLLHNPDCYLFTKPLEF